MNLVINAIGKLTNSHKNEQILINNYLKRLPWKLKINEFVAKGSTIIQRSKEEESELLLNDLGNEYFIIALDEQGVNLTSINFSKLITNKAQDYRIAFLIGGAYGHGNLVKKRADLLLSLGLMTFPHIIARLILVEQLYRAYTIGMGHPYHKSN